MYNFGEQIPVTYHYILVLFPQQRQKDKGLMISSLTDSQFYQGSQQLWRDYIMEAFWSLSKQPIKITTTNGLEWIGSPGRTGSDTRSGGSGTDMGLAQEAWAGRPGLLAFMFVLLSWG